MKKYLDSNGNQIEMGVEKMFDIACEEWQYRIEHESTFASNPRLKKLIKESIKNRKEIIETIRRSESHKLAQSNDSQEVHFIAIVDGGAHCLKSMVFSTTDGAGIDQIMFVYEKTYNRFNYRDFQTDVFSPSTGGLDSVWANFQYEIIEETK